MKAFRSFAAMLVVAALALFVHDYYKRTDRREARDEAAIIREQTRALQQQAQELNQRLRSVNEAAAALKDEVAGQRRDIEARKAQQLIADYLNEGLQVAASARTAVAESYQTNLRWPASNQEAGIPEPAQLKARSLQRVEVARNGVITLTYDEKSGVAGGLIILVPQAHPASTAISWQCESPSYANIAAVIPQCRYAKVSK